MPAPETILTVSNPQAWEPGDAAVIEGNDASLPRGTYVVAAVRGFDLSLRVPSPAERLRFWLLRKLWPYRARWRAWRALRRTRGRR